MTGPRIALVHATPLAIGPIAKAFAADWPEAELFNLLEDSLPRDRSRHPPGDPELTQRFLSLGRYAEMAGAAAVLFTCSAFGREIDAARGHLAVPTLKPNEAMFDEAIRTGRRVAMLATFEPAIASMREELCALAACRGVPIELRCMFVPGAFDALQAGNDREHDRLIVEAARLAGPCDVLVLAQFSMASARAEVQRQTGVRTLSSPGSAVAALRAALLGVSRDGT